MAELTPAGAAEYAACFLARWASYADGSSDEPPGDLAPEYLRVLLAERDQLRRDLEKARKDRDSWQAIAASREPSAEPDPLNLPVFAWGESVTWHRGRILVPLNRDDQTVADLVLDEDGAGTLSAMLTDVAHPLGVVEFPQDISDEEMTRWAAAWDAAQGPERPLTLNVGNRTATFRAKPWPAEYDADAVARETAERTPPGESVES